MKATFELIQHTADMGIRARAATPEELLPAAAAGLYAVIGRLEPVDEAGERLRLALDGLDRAGLLREFLAELLYYYEAEERLAARIEVVRFEEGALELILELRPLSPERSEVLGEVKAVTYHELALTRREDGTQGPYYEAMVIVDL